MSGLSWLWVSLWGRLPTPTIEIALVIFSILAGTFLGDERQRREKPAGLRTLVLVCLGATIFTMTGLAFTSATGDSGRVAAQIVTGIGFLGAGVILHGRRLVSGVTTAAVIWVAAAIGMTIGAGYPIAGLALSVTVNRFLKLAVLFETRWHPDLHDARYVITYAPNNGLTRVRLERIFIDYEPIGVVAAWDEETRGEGRVTVTMRLPRLHMYDLLADVADVADVTSVVRERYDKCAPTEELS
jgi:putative Mg2+ transporter-C (MgtC) family protein